MSSPREPDEASASSSESKGKAVNPSEHLFDGGGNANEADKDKDEEDAEPMNAVKPPNPATSASSSKSKGKAVDPAEHPNISNGGGNVDEDDEDEEDAESIDEDNGVKHPNPATSSKAKKTFGMHKAPHNARRGNDPSNYEDRFPEDPIYAETAPNARVWRTHQAESEIHDVNMVEEIRDNVDVLLVFAGLFSAVVTAFVVQTSQSLQADYAQVSASLLFELVLVQRAIANGSPVNTLQMSQVWVNGLWFTSLFLSLTTALVAVLVKQWLHHYVALPSGTPRDWCFVRQYRFLGFQKWRVEVIVGVLPVLMHLALALFFIGLSLFLHPLRAALSWVVCMGTILLIVAYVIVTILPMCFPQCPYRTPLCDLAYPPCIYVTSLVQLHYHQLCRLLQQFLYRTPLFDLAYPPFIYITSLVQKQYHRLLQLLQSIVSRVTRNNNFWNDSGPNHPMAKPNSLKQLELKAVEKASLRLSVEALQWLFSASSNPAVQSIVVESIGGLPMEAQVEVEDVFCGSLSIVDIQENLLSSLTELHAVDWMPILMPSISLGMEHKFERLLRSCMFSSRVNPPWVNHPWAAIDVPDQLDQNEFSATLLIQIPKLCWSDGFLELHKPNVFLHDILSLEMPARFPPIIWKNLIQLATNSWNPDLFNIDDQFPMLLCSAVAQSSIVYTGALKQQLFASPLVVDFQQAVEYFPEMALKYMMCTVTSETSEIWLLAIFLKECIYIEMDPEAIWKILELVIMDTPIFSQDAPDSKYDECYRLVLECYSDFMKESNSDASHIHAPLPALQLLVPFITTQWSTLQTSTRAHAALKFLGSCLQACFRPAYDVFHQQQCLKFLAERLVSSWSASLLKAYVIGVAIAVHPSYGDPEENQTILQAIDCLHKPENLFLVCSTLAMYTHKTVYEVAGYPDIMTALAQIRPLDPAWANCLQRLQALAEDENCFVRVEREVWQIGKEEEEIKEWRYNMHVAIKTLEVFFSDIPPHATASLELVQLPPTLLALDVVEESLARAAATSVSVSLRRSPATLASTATTR
ncbi:hypothetical protein EDD85DRAFT_787870 [Armillaria nabsnona]|nr:hypothetical protein EDD85DRAFT_787870 [Armillaria nabsnona]